MEDARLAEVMKLGEPVRFQKEYIRKDGSRAPVELFLNLAHDAESGEPYFCMFATDIAERKLAEQALRVSEERFRKVFEYAATGIAITDWDGRFQQCNPAYCVLLGYTAQELRVMRSLDLVHPADRNANLVELRCLQEGGVKSFEFENRYLRKDGAVVWVHKFVSLLRDKNGSPGHVVVLVSDVTERRRMEEALREADRRKDEFLATLAHELRNPLRPIRNALHVLHRSPAAPRRCAVTCNDAAAGRSSGAAG